MAEEKRDVFKACEAADAEVRSGPHGWIQWKGTSVCLDVHCSCGTLTHVDADFAYHVKCGACGRVYMVSGNVRLLEITPAELEDNGGNAVVSS